MHPTVAKVVDAATRSGLDIAVVHSDEHTRTAQDAADALGVEVGQIVKSLVFIAHGGVVDGPIVALICGANRCDTDKLARVTGAERIGRADAEMVRASTGFAIGGVPPFGYPAPLPVFVDARLLDHEVLWAAAGTPNDNFSCAPGDLVRVSGGLVCDIARA